MEPRLEERLLPDFPAVPEGDGADLAEFGGEGRKCNAFQNEGRKLNAFQNVFWGVDVTWPGT